MYEGFDLTDFWKDSDYARKEYVDEPFSLNLVRSIEQTLGFKLPPSYIELMRSQNGGIPLRTCHPTKKATSWADDHIAIVGFLSIGQGKTYSLLGRHGSKFHQESWGYPDYGICICTCPSAGHDMIMLDYRKCGSEGEPSVVHVDQERRFRATLLAPDFETFVRGLVPASAYDNSAADLAAAIQKIQTGSFSTALKQLLAQAPSPVETELALRKLLSAIATKKGRFSLHADSESYLVYDVLFDLFSSCEHVLTPEHFLGVYSHLIPFGNGDIRIGGYSPSLLTNWMDLRLSEEIIQRRKGRLLFYESYRAELRKKLMAYLK